MSEAIPDRSTPDSSYRDRVRFSVLGPLRVDGAAGPVEVKGSKERTLLAHLVAAGGAVVGVEDLVDGLWGEQPPRTAAKSLQTYVLRLRNALEPNRAGAPSVVVTDGRGYRLVTVPDAIDAQRFSRLLGLAGRGGTRERLAFLVQALELWRGPAYAGLMDNAVLRAEATRLEELRMGAIEDRWEIELELGGARRAAAELHSLTSAHPLRERLWRLLVTALYRDGRQAEALAAYEHARSHLAEELGIDPGPELRALHARVLAQDPALRGPEAADRLPERLSDRTPLHGRAAELAVLRRAWADATPAEPGLVVVRARPGAGARRLVGALAQEVAEAGGSVVHLQRPGDELDGEADLVVQGRWNGQRPAGATLTVALAPSDAAVPTGAVVVDLGPLDRDAVRAVVLDYVAPDEVDAAADRVLADSGGWPARVHAAAVDYVRTRAAADVRVATAASVQSRTSLREARTRLADSVLDLRSAEDRVAVPEDRCPWPGLAAYDVGDGDWFAGRERLVAELLARIAASTCVMVLGASGSGKSSLLRAGLIAALADDQLPGSAGWDVVMMRPGPHPMRELTQQVLDSRRPDVGETLERLLRNAEGAAENRTLLVVDQLEEVWTACSEESERRAFLDTLAAVLAAPASRTSVVVAIRADYLDRLADHPQLAHVVGEETVLVGAPTADDVRRVVERPAQRAGLELDAGLVDAIVEDAGQEPGALPLLSTALAQLWQLRSGRRVTLAHYVHLGGVEGAISHLAEAAWDRLDDGQREVTRPVLLRLAGPGEGDQVTRRRVPVAELLGLDLPHVADVVESLTSARLLSRSEDHVEVAHEALFREWPRLRGWLAEDAAGRAVQRRLAVAAQEWESEDRESTMLWRGSRLEAGLEVARIRPDEVTSVERAFLTAGRDAVEAARAAAERQVVTERRQNRRLRGLLVGVAALLAVALLAAVLALVARERASEAATEAEAKRLAASALSIEYPDLALLAAVEATRLERSPETYGALLTLLARQPDVVTAFRTEERFLRSASTPDGTTVFVSENEPVLRALDAETGEQLWVREDLSGQVGRIAPSPDGRHLAVTVLSGPLSGVELLDAQDGRRVWRIEGEDAVRFARDPQPSPLWFGLGWSDRGQVVFANDQHVFIADRTGRLVDAVPWGRPVRDTQSLLVLPGDAVSTGSSEAGPGARVVLETGESTALEEDTYVAAAAPDGRQVVLVSGTMGEQEFQLADRRTLRPRGRAWPTQGDLRAVEFAPDGSSFAVALDENVLLRDPETGSAVRELAGHSGAVMGMTFAGPDHDLLWTAGRDGRAVAFDTSGRRGVIAATDIPDAPHTGERAGGTAAWVEFEEVEANRIVIRSAAASRGQPVSMGNLADCICQPSGSDVTPDGSIVAAGIVHFGNEGPDPSRGHVITWDADARTVRAVIATPWPVLGVGATPDGDRLVVSGSRGWGVLDARTLELRGRWYELDEAPLVGGDGSALVEVSPDSQRAALLRGTEIVLVDVATGAVRARARPDPGADLFSLDWTGDSSELAVGSVGGWLQVFDGGDLAPVSPRRLITGGFVIDVEISPDGQTAATMGSDGDVTLWDTRTWRPYGLPVLDDLMWGYLAFSDDSRWLDVEYEIGRRVRVAIEPAAWVAAACGAANRELTPDEVEILLPGVERTGHTCR